MIWDSKDRVLIGKTALKSPSRCCHLDKTNSFVAVGSTAGSLTIYFLTDFMEKGGHFYRVDEVAYRKDCQSEATEVSSCAPFSSSLPLFSVPLLITDSSPFSLSLCLLPFLPLLSSEQVKFSPSNDKIAL